MSSRQASLALACVAARAAKPFLMSCFGKSVDRPAAKRLCVRRMKARMHCMETSRAAALVSLAIVRMRGSAQECVWEWMPDCVSKPPVRSCLVTTCETRRWYHILLLSVCCQCRSAVQGPVHRQPCGCANSVARACVCENPLRVGEAHVSPPHLVNCPLRDWAVVCCI